MKKLWSNTKRLFSNRVFITLLGVIALTIIIWFGGPLLAISDYRPWQTETARLFTLLIVALFWGFSNFRHKLKTEKSNDEILQQMSEPGEGEFDTATKEEISFLQKRMQDALQILKNSKLAEGKKLYSLPWYIIIGPPGSGKTTALHNSGLNFPLKEQLGTDAIHGIGGTRNCDWWFTDRAIMLDTAGRYTTQDSNAKADSSAWTGFLDLLKKNRPRRPINGVLVSVSITDLVTQTPTERNIYARSIKQRLQELHNRLGINFPIYVLFTKADLIAGFNEFFDDLSREEREQVWGITFDGNQNENVGGVVADFNRRFLELVKRANERVYALQNNERETERRSLIYEFPRQLRAMQDAMDVFLKEIFSPNKFEQNPLLRGVYIASATQEGTPIDKVIGKYAEGLGLAAKQPISHSGTGKGFFLKRLFNEVIFPEQNLATANFSLEKKSIMLRRAAIVSSVVVTLTCLAGWSYSYNQNLEFVALVDKQIENYTELTNGGLSKETDLITLNAGLLELRNLPRGFDNSEESVPSDMQWGLYLGDKFGAQASETYLNAINHIFVPYIVRVLEKQIANNLESSEFLYTSLKFYLMLKIPEKMDKELFSLWMAQEWQRILPGKINDDVRGNLMQHLRVALDSDSSIPKLDERLIQQARNALQASTFSERAYLRLKEDVADIVPPGFKITDIVNARKARLFTRRSGRPLSEEVPGLFSYEGYHGIFKIEGKSLLKRLSQESWIYGEEFSEQLKNENIDELYAGVEELYFDEYISRWKALIEDIELDGFSTPQEGEEVLRQLTTGRKPIQALVQNLVKNIQLTKGTSSKLQDGLQKLDAIDKATPEGLESTRLVREKNRLTRLLPKNISESGKPTLPGEEVEIEFADFLYFALGDVENGDQAQSEEIMPTLKSLQKYLQSLADKDDGSIAFQAKLASNDSSLSIKHLQNYGQDMPKPINQWMAKLATDAEKLTVSGTQKHFASIWNNTVLKEYQTAIAGRYPLNKSSSKHIKLNDFKRFFGYGGTLDSFFEQHLSPFVDKKSSPWSFKSAIGIKQSTLRQFQRADKIKQMFFKPGTQQLNVEFSLVPKFLDTQVSQFVLQVEDQSMTYRHGPTKPVPFIWPGESNSETARFVFIPHNGGKSSNLEKKGPWSWFRLLDLVADKSNSSRESIELKFLSQGNEAIVDLVTDSVVNPFDSKTLERFRCPPTL